MLSSNIRCLLVHNRYQQQGGEDRVVEAEKKLLEQHGHEVRLFQVDNNNINGLFDKVKIGVSATYSYQRKQEISKEIESFKPDIVHVHNFFPQLTPSVYDACAEYHIPVIQTLHNFRLICPGALLLRQKKTCELCVTGSPYNAVLHKCYRNSIVQSLAVAKMVSYHRNNKTWSDKVTRFITLTEFSRDKFITSGFPSSRMTIKPNFIDDIDNISSTQNTLDHNTKPYALFVGRLSEEKGVNILLDAWKNIPLDLHIVGDGELDILSEQKNNIHFFGKLDHPTVQQQMRHAKILVMPSICFETFGMVIIEAFSQGLPVIASRLGAMKEIIEDGKTGFLFEPGNSRDLEKKVNNSLKNPEKIDKMRVNAREAYLEKYTPQKNYKILMKIYIDAINEYDS